jgi:predicted dithiol-disulfide oxidoreductase (DUF899 family)
MFAMKASPASLHHITIPGESAEFRKARNALLVEEMELRRQTERVAEQRRKLPPGPLLKEDYKFEAVTGPVKFSQLFDGKDTLAVYSFMFGPERERPCPGCTHSLDSMNGAAEHIAQRLNYVVVAKSPIKRILAFAKERGWNRLKFLSTAGNNYDRDYFGDSENLSAAVRKQQDFKDGKEWDMPMLNVFHREKNGDIRYFWGSEVLYVPPEPGQEYRHNDGLDPFWNMLDRTPEGRGDFHPKLEY